MPLAPSPEPNAPMNPKLLTVLISALLTISITAQHYAEPSFPQWNTPQLPSGTGTLATISGALDGVEDADIFVIYVDTPSTFFCIVDEGATWDTQLSMFDMQGNGISFRDDTLASIQSTLTGQFLQAPGYVMIAVSHIDNDALDGSQQQLWMDQPYEVERQPDGPGAANAFAQWSQRSTSAGAYTLRFRSASYAHDNDAEQPTVAWAWSNVASPSEPYTPALQYQYTSTGQRIKIENWSTGRYRVNFGRMPSGGVLHVTPYSGNGLFGSSSNTACIDFYWSNGLETEAYVSTFNAAGDRANMRFNVHYRVGGASDERAAYCFANDRTAASYTPDPTFQWNGGRAPMTIARVAVGQYQVTIPGLSTSGQGVGGHVQVSSYGGQNASSPTYAKVASWAPAGPNMKVYVRTFDATGAASDERFMLSYHQDAAPIAQHKGSGAHVWANAPTAASYTPASLYSASNGTAGPHIPPTITRTGVGSYSVDLADVSSSGASIAMATAHGTAPSYASVESWGPLASGGTRVRVRTRSIGGAAVDATFTLLYLTDHAAGAAATNGAYGAGCAGLGLTADSRPVLGQLWELRGFDLPPATAAAVMMVGTNRTLLSLEVAGAFTCFAHTEPIFNSAISTADPRLLLGVPSSPSLIGQSLHGQAVAISPTFNALGAVTSNGVTGVIGDV